MWYLVEGEVEVRGMWYKLRSTFFTEYSARLYVHTWNKRGDKLEYKGPIEPKKKKKKKHA